MKYGAEWNGLTGDSFTDWVLQAQAGDLPVGMGEHFTETVIDQFSYLHLSHKCKTIESGGKALYEIDVRGGTHLVSPRLVSSRL